MEDQPNGVATVKKKPPMVAVFLVFALCNLVIGSVGGVMSFVLLSNSNAPVVQQVRDFLGFTDGSGVAVPVRQTIQVEESSAIIDAAKKVSSAVVSISTSRQVQDFFGRVSNQEIGGGTGFILTADGLIVTNKHVVSESGTYSVILSDGSVHEASIQAIDSLNDFAVLKIVAKDLPVVELGSSDALQIGQHVLAVGNALGEFKNSVTLGVVSAKQRSLETSANSGSEKLTDLIQTDAAINPGNSGGPLVNLAGQVVGINTAIASTSGGSIGVGFAIPIDGVKTAIESVRKTGKIVRPYMGVRSVAITKSLQQVEGLPVDHGALVARGNGTAQVAVLPGSPADRAGIQENDIILEVNGKRIDETTTLKDVLKSAAVGDTVTVKLYRKGEEITVKMTLDAQP
jgi:serine protease Do